jgi:hypothetical protein
MISFFMFNKYKKAMPYQTDCCLKHEGKIKCGIPEVYFEVVASHKEGVVRLHKGVTIKEWR